MFEGIRVLSDVAVHSTPNAKLKIRKENNSRGHSLLL